jgi:hypothetical protein
MVGHSDREFTNSSNKYLTTSTSTTSIAAPLHQVVHKLNPDFNVIRPHIIINLMHHLAPERMPLALLVQQEAEHAEQIRDSALESVCIERSASNTQPP